MPALDAKQIICDPEDRARIDARSWTIDADGRIRATVNNKQIRLHKFVLPDIDFIDHKNGNQLDVRKTNLRPATVVRNGWNRGKSSVNTSGYKGVFERKDVKERRWLAKITFFGHQNNIGRFNTPEDAAHAYDCKALDLHGDFACINFDRNDYELVEGKYSYRPKNTVAELQQSTDIAQLS